jgi:long-chain acyl-CoA synthetase
MALVCQIGVGFTTAFAECLVKVLDNAQEVNPTLIGGAPRFFEKVQQFICQRIQQEAAVKQQVFAWAEDVGRKVARRREQGKPVRPGLLAQHRFASRLALDKVKASFGSRLRVALSAGAPLDGTLAEWYAAVGIPLMNAYGLTEVCGASHATRPGANRFGSVGRPLAGIETKILPSGEICLRGPTVGTQPYVSPGPREGSSPEPMPNDGWFATGDRGFVDEEGYLFLVERKRERSSESSKQAMPEGLGP